MAKRFPELNDTHIKFIQAQKIFFVGTAAETGRVNISPKGMDALRVVNSNQVAWLNLSGSGNETSAHVQQIPRMTLMLCAFEGNPNILRLYGTPRMLHSGHPEWEENLALFSHTSGARQIFILDIDLVQTSCGFGVPLFNYEGDRETLTQWSNNKDETELKAYWEKKNQVSLDGLDTHIVELSE